MARHAVPLPAITPLIRSKIMCFFEYNWAAQAWQFRIGDRFTDYRGERSWPTLADVRATVETQGLTLVKTDTRTYQLRGLQTFAYSD
jgi:hypothetical protein